MYSTHNLGTYFIAIHFQYKYIVCLYNYENKIRISTKNHDLYLSINIYKFNLQTI